MYSFNIFLTEENQLLSEMSFTANCRLAYHVENTGSRPITEVKQTSPVRTWMGDRLGIPGAVDFCLYFFHYLYCYHYH